MAPEQAFANRAETSPAWALDELAAMASAGDVAGARAAAATLAPFWDSAVRRGRTAGGAGAASGLFGKALRAADAVADAETAAMLLQPFRIENLTDESRGLVREDRRRLRSAVDGGTAADWFGGSSRPGRTAVDRNGRSGWRTGCPACARGCTPRAALARRPRSGSLDLAWEWISKDIGTGLASSSPSRRDRNSATWANRSPRVLTAAAAIGAASTRDTVSGYIRQQDDAVTMLEMSALRAAAELPRDGAQRRRRLR